MVGRFDGPVVVEWLSHPGDDRDMRVLQPFAFIDESGKRWSVPKGAIVNGASIPPIFWSTIGPPFVGDYRRASVVHDHHCVVRTEPAKAVHRMFHAACLAGGVASARAGIMYAAVKTFGPNWTSPASIAGTFGLDTLRADEAVDLYTTMATDDFADMRQTIEAHDPSLEEIDAMIMEKAIVVPMIPVAAQLAF